MGICQSVCHSTAFNPKPLTDCSFLAGASDVQESALETSAGGVASGQPGGLLGRKASVPV